MKTLAQQVGHRIKIRRAILEMTQTQLAEAVGIAQGYMSALETGKKNMDLELLERIARALHCLPVDLIDERKKAA
jgi:transcriptional regulator with XRE-family HTH domain